MLWVCFLYLTCSLLADAQAEHTIQQGMQQEASENFLEAGAEEMAATIPIDEQSQNTQPLTLIHNVTPSEDSLRIEVKCLTLESLERLWQDYRSGQLNRMAEKLLVTDDIKQKFNVESITLKTTISEDDYLACKEYLSKRPGKVSQYFLKILKSAHSDTFRRDFNFDYTPSVVKLQCCRVLTVQVLNGV